MIEKEFGNVRLSRLGLGNMRLPTKNGRIDEERAAAIVDEALASGINYFDTAYVYHSGESEPFLGRTLKRHPRSSYHLATKFNVDANPDIEKTFEDQLARLDTDYVDFYLFHCVTRETARKYMDPDRHYLDYLLQQKAKGRIRHLGFSSHADLETLERFLSFSDQFEFVQIQLNYLDWTMQDAKGQYETIVAHGLPIWVMEPVRGGRLADLGKDNRLLLRRHPDWSVSSWAFRWLFSLDHVQMILSGMSNLEQLRDNIKTFEDCQPLTEDERMLLSNLAAKMQRETAVPCTACRYCCDTCPKRIDIPRFLSLFNVLSLNDDEGIREEVRRSHPGPLDCIACQSCQKHCPQGIEIPKILRQLSSR